MKKQDTIPVQLVRRRRLSAAVEIAAFIALAGAVAGSAVVVKEAQARARLSSLSAVASESTVGPSAVDPVPAGAQPAEAALNNEAAVREVLIDTVEPIDDPLNVRFVEPVPPAEIHYPADTRFFNARAVRPARTIWMTVTAYSPDSRSCGDSADGITSSIHNVYTNAMKLVAADSHILPLGAMISVPGYDSNRLVPVLDRGGAIKGYRIDLLFPTHEAARKWGVKHLPITVWEYADGQPRGDFRKIRDSKN